jgi:uncharacterized protein YdeI (YjbR/CyaY-like superfamily)
MNSKQELPVKSFASPAEWVAWLDAEHESSAGVWIKLAKKGSGIASVSQQEAVEVALRYGWIDGQARSLDDQHWLQRYTPRRPRSRWSKRNRAKAIELIERGEMKPAGMREVARAKADGSWDAAYDSQSEAVVPDDLRLELERNPAARELFETLDSQNRYAILHRIQDAKRPETRARRIAKFVDMLGEGRKPHP